MEPSLGQTHWGADGRSGRFREPTRSLHWSEVSAMAMLSVPGYRGGLCLHWTHHNYASSKYLSACWCVSGTLPDPSPLNHSFPRIPRLIVWKPCFTSLKTGCGGCFIWVKMTCYVRSSFRKNDRTLRFKAKVEKWPSSHHLSQRL